MEVEDEGWKDGGGRWNIKEDRGEAGVRLLLPQWEGREGMG